MPKLVRYGATALSGLAVALFLAVSPALAEMRFYEQRGLITGSMLAKAYKRLVGDEIGAALTAGDTAKREAVMADWMPKKHEPKPATPNASGAPTNDADPNLGGPPNRNLKPL